MKYRKSDFVEWQQAPEEWFTGRAWFGPMVEQGGEINVLGVAFEPGARTDWHSHPGGQVLHCVSGRGLVANEAGERLAITPGDTVQVPAGEVHWHGAAKDSPMFHLSITTEETRWLDRAVGDDEYRGM
jgi:quercetin dioxygenase-like cupin family protein